ncbi:MAG: hypothetical protein ACRCZF_04285 [Gemmataceae bacterium]
MMRWTVFVALFGCGLMGCTHIQPVGPLADSLGLPTKPTKGPGKPSEPDPEPIVQQAPRPSLPAVFVTPGEVTGLNAEDAAKRLQQELDTDRRAMEAMPRISEMPPPKK